jgi:hypothetical protein
LSFVQSTEDKINAKYTCASYIRACEKRDLTTIENIVCGSYKLKSEGFLHVTLKCTREGIKYSCHTDYMSS